MSTVAQTVVYRRRCNVSQTVFRTNIKGHESCVHGSHKRFKRHKKCIKRHVVVELFQETGIYMSFTW
jgi:hypothetical protein